VTVTATYDHTELARSPVEPRPMCQHCHGLGYVGQHHRDPQLDTRETCDECEGQGYAPPLDEPPNELTPAAVQRPGVMTDSH
jgi:DnaJ-class molecular chaperone